MCLNKNLRIQSTLILLLLIASLASLLSIGLVAYTSAQDALRERVFSQMTGYREARAAMLGDYFNFLRGQALTLSEDRMVVEAVNEFGTAYGKLADQLFARSRKSSSRITTAKSTCPHSPRTSTPNWPWRLTCLPRRSRATFSTTT